MDSTGGGRAVQLSNSGLGIVLQSVAAFRPHRQPKATAALVLYIVGLLCVFVLQAPPTTPAQLAAFKAKVAEAEAVVGSLSHAQRRLIELEVDLDRHKGWFWRFNQQQRDAVDKRMPAVRAARQRVAELQRQRDAKVREAKAGLGLWSEAGLEESRELFWQSFSAGKVFAQRQTLWDAAFSILTSRDRDLGLLFQLLIQTLINFTTGLVLSVFIFLLRLPGLIISFGAAFWSALPFFALAAAGAISVVLSYLGLLYAAGVGVAYTTVKFVAHRRQQLLEAQGPERRRLVFDDHSHWD